MLKIINVSEVLIHKDSCSGVTWIHPGKESFERIEPFHRIRPDRSLLSFNGANWSHIRRVLDRRWPVH